MIHDLNMDKNKSQQESEKEIYKSWEEKGYFKANPASAKEQYSLLMPPPNLTGDPHMGHAMQHSILDAIARFKRMQGYDVLLLPGVDHAGIQFEGTLNKRLEKQGLSRKELGREKWLEEAWKFKDQVYNSYHGTWTIFGVSADWSREVFSLEDKVQQAVVTEFKTFWEQELLYKGAYIVQWCPKDATAIEDVEMEYLEKKEKLYYVKYKIVGNSKPHPSPDLIGASPLLKGEGEFITVATARPETIAADVAIAMFPEHQKYKSLLGKKAINPFTNTEIPVIEDERVEKEFGTGALKITPGHDILDYEIGKTHGLPVLHVVNKTGRITDLDTDLAGLKIHEAREKAADKLRKAGLIEKEEDYTHSVPVCERCKTTVEPLISEEWFVKMKPLAEKALKRISEINFAPENYNKIISDWLKEIHDWSISRSLWWGYRIPVWFCRECNKIHAVGKDKGMIISYKKPELNCPVCGENAWEQDEQVLDTWFSSGLWPLATLGWPDENRELERYFPWSFEITAPEIKYLWIARMIMLSLWFRDNIPFKNMFFHGTLRDLQGRKMSKSLGNGVDPVELINQWGTDAVRMTLYSYSTPGRDPRASRQTMDERCKNFRNFGTKIRNIYRFIYELQPSGHLEGGHDSFKVGSNPEDKAIIEKLETTIKEVTKNIEQFNLHLATENLYNFIWHDLADIYIEQSKKRRAEAQPVLEYVFNTCLKLLHPFMPFLAEELYLKLPEHRESIMIEEWPALKGTTGSKSTTSTTGKST